MEYNHWVEEQQRQITELRKALQVHTTDIELQILVESSLNHYHNLFCMKANAAKADVFYLMSGIWRTSAERFFHWIGGFRPSELLNVITYLTVSLIFDHCLPLIPYYAFILLGYITSVLCFVEVNCILVILEGISYYLYRSLKDRSFHKGILFNFYSQVEPWRSIRSDPLKITTKIFSPILDDQW